MSASTYVSTWVICQFLRVYIDLVNNIWWWILSCCMYTVPWCSLMDYYSCGLDDFLKGGVYSQCSVFSSLYYMSPLKVNKWKVVSSEFIINTVNQRCSLHYTLSYWNQNPSTSHKVHFRAKQCSSNHTVCFICLKCALLYW